MGKHSSAENKLTWINLWHVDKTGVNTGSNSSFSGSSARRALQRMGIPVTVVTGTI